jgi:hypothetical protein
MSESKRFGAEGGKKRAASLTKRELSDAARQAALARWGKDLPVAEYMGVLRFGEVEVSCAVLGDGTRVLTQAELLEALGRHRKANVRNVEGEENTPPILQGERLKPFISSQLLAKSKPIRFRTKSGSIASGYRAEILPEICRVYLDADAANALMKQQRHIAGKARVLLAALSTVGIIALVDEATGFKASSEQMEIARFLRVYVNKEIAQWLPTFPRSFFEQLCRLKGLDLKDDMRMPQYMGIVINELVYSRIAPGVLAELKSVNPVVGPKGRRKGKHHQFMTKDVGNPKLQNLIGRLEGIAYAFPDGAYDEYKRTVDRLLPNYGSLPLWRAAQIPERVEQAHAKLLPASTGAEEERKTRELPLFPNAS